MARILPKIQLTVDTVVFSIINEQLHVLLIRRKNEPFKGEYAIPGGFVDEGESLIDAAKRELHEETNVKGLFLKKLNAYGDVGRDPRGRVVSVAFIALIDSEKFKLKADTDALEAIWVDVDMIKKMAFDHMVILKDALAELRYDIQTTNIVAQLLPDKFTLSELQAVYENILGMPLDKRNFRKKIDSFDIVKPLNETKREGAHRPAQLFSFKEKKYTHLKDKIHVFL